MNKKIVGYIDHLDNVVNVICDINGYEREEGYLELYDEEFGGGGGYEIIYFAEGISTMVSIGWDNDGEYGDVYQVYWDITNTKYPRPKTIHLFKGDL